MAVTSQTSASMALAVSTSFSTVAATVAVVACGRYEFALPMARDEDEAAVLLALCARIGLLVLALSVPLAALLNMTGHLPLPWLLPLAVAAAGALQLLIMWSNRAQRFRALAISRVLQYGGAALLQVALGVALWGAARQPAGAEAAWALVIAPVISGVLAALVLVQPAPAGGWRALLPARAHPGMRQVAVKFRDFPLLNTPHAFLGALQDALAVAMLVAFSGHAAAGFWGLGLRYLKAPATLVGSAVSQALYPRLAGV